jgi:hypothetical protein
MVKELTTLRSMNMSVNMNTLLNQGRDIDTNYVSFSNHANNLTPIYENKTYINEKIAVSDDEEDEDDDDEDEDEDEDEDDEEDDDEVEDEDDEEDTNPQPVKILHSPIDEDDIVVQEIDTVKVITMNVASSFDVEEINTEPEEEFDVDNVDTPVELDENTEQLHVEKITTENESLENNSVVEDVSKDSKDLYIKMNVQSLKALVITKGLSSDPSKLKKVELLKLLEDMEN